jgi:hypothetical protein
VAVSGTQIDVSWQNVSGENGYYIFRSSTSNGSYSQIASTGANVNSYSNTGLSINTQYCYKVKSYNSAGESGFSPFDCATTSSSSPPSTLILQNINLVNGQSICYDATQTITVAGSGTTFTVQSGADATLIAGQNILILPGTMVYSGADLLSYITTNGQYCGTLQSAIVSTDTTTPVIKGDSIQNFIVLDFVLYPNPSTGLVTLEFTMESGEQDFILQVYNMNGKRVIAEELHAIRSHVFDISAQVPGIYLVQVIRGDRVETEKVMKQ